MSQPRSRSSRRRVMQSAAETLSVTSLLCAAGGLSAQHAETKPVTKNDPVPAPTDLKEMVIEASLYNPQRLQSPKYTEPLRDVPQTITVIPKVLMQERGAYSLRDVLRNTPGISMQAGEGVSGAGTGDNPAIRGFSSRSDWFIDGMRDLGTYNRDPFNTEQVEVAKGPASTMVGRGSTGGSINLVTKMASLTPFNQADMTYGSSHLYRGTLDVNEPLGDHVALRLNGMYHHADTPGRDDVFQERYGIAASLAFGLGTDTRFTLNYQRLEENNMPDFGIPWVPAVSGTSSFSGMGSGLENYGNQMATVSYDSFYGRRNYDYQKNQGDVVTGIFEHDFSKKLRLRNLTRYSRLHADGRVTAPRFRDTSAAAGNQYTSILVREEQRRRITNEYFANQTLLMADFDTGPLKHALVTGMELYWERQVMALRAGNTSTTDLYDPSVSGPLVGPVNVNRDTTVFGVSPTDFPGAGETHLDTISFFIFDTLKAGRHWEMVAGVRYDHIDAEQRGTYPTGANDIFGNFGVPPISNREDLFSWKAALIFKPVEHGSIYAGYATSFNPTIDGGVNGSLGLASFGAAGASTQGLDAEETHSYELGTKWDLLKERLSLTAALFRTDKINARVTNAGLTTLAGELQVRGVELGLAGQLTKNWQIFAGATHLNSEYKKSTNPVEIGQNIPNTPEYTFNLWTTYNLLERCQIGLGTQYMGEVIGSTTNPGRVVSDYWTVDAMLAYRFSEKLTLRLNIYNLADTRYIETSSSTGHVIPGPGRSVALTASVRF